nr:hypothetical protein [uncultured Steroidobacter sp.]
MKEKTEETKGKEVQGIEMIDLGDAREETRQWNPVQILQDSPVSWGRTPFEL